MLKSHTIEDLKKLKGKTDWSRVAVTEAEILADEDDVLPYEIDWENSVAVHGLEDLATKMQSFQERKNQLTIRFDNDVVTWFKSFGRGYQSRMNAVLREFMLQQQQLAKARQQEKI